MFEMYTTNYIDSNKIYQTTSISSNLQNWIPPTNSTKPNLEKPNVQKIKEKSDPSLSWAQPSSAPACNFLLLGVLLKICNYLWSWISWLLFSFLILPYLILIFLWSSLFIYWLCVGIYDGTLFLMLNEESPIVVRWTISNVLRSSTILNLSFSGIQYAYNTPW